MSEQSARAVTEEPPALVETHSALLVFLGDRVYKMKKPVALGFLDFSTLEARLAACRREVELNRRFAPDVYLGVADVVGPEGHPCEHLVVMRRLPADRSMTQLVRAGAAVDGHLRELARILAAVHSAPDSVVADGSIGSVPAVRSLWQDGLAQCRRLAAADSDRDVVARTSELVDRYLTGRGPLFARRVRDGWIRDGHGDLLADDIYCLDDGVRVLDCLEFDDRLRQGDVLADVAFLAMDLERLGRGDLAEQLLQWYDEFSGETHPASLAHHYIAYRAHVRSKVCWVRHAQGERVAADQARLLAGLALSHLERARVRLVLIGGAPGTGKSTLAAGVTDALGWTLLRSDVVRKELAGLPAKASASSGYRSGIYSPEFSDDTYGELLRRARHALTLGESVIVDATWSDARHRSVAAAMANATSSDLVEVCCTLPPGVADTRLRARSAEGDNVSEADPAIAAQVRDHTDPWPAAVVVSTLPEPAAVLREGVAVVTASPTVPSVSLPDEAGRARPGLVPE